MKRISCSIVILMAVMCARLAASDLPYSPLVHGNEISAECAAQLADQKDRILLHFGSDMSKSGIPSIADSILNVGYRIEAHPVRPTGLTIVYIGGLVSARGLNTGALNIHLDKWPSSFAQICA